MRRKFMVNVEVPEGVSVTGMANYIREAVSMWSKGTNPAEAMFEIGDRPVYVRALKLEKYVRPLVCEYCGGGRHQKGFKHKFCSHCGRIEEHCECANYG